MAKSTAKKNSNASKNNNPNNNPISVKSLLLKLVDGRLPKIVGTLFLLLSLFLVMSLGSYVFTWQEDQDAVFSSKHSLDFLFNHQGEIQNTAGRLGAWVSHQLIYNGFGISSILLAVFFAIWGIKLLFNYRIASPLRTFFYTTLFILTLSPILSYFFAAERYRFAYGGAMGNTIIHFLNGVAGELGTLFIIIGLILILVILFFNPIFHLSFLQKKSPEIQNTEVPVSTNPEPVKRKKSDKVETNIPVPENPFGEGEIPLDVPDSFFEKNEETTVVEEENLDETFDETNEVLTEVIDSKPLELTTESLGSNNQPEDLTLEVVPHESDKVVDDAHAHISVATQEPYDPSLELRNYKYPTLDLLENRGIEEISIDKNELEQNKNQIINTLKSFGISIAKISATVGPTVTLYEIVPSEGVRISKIRNLEDDIALSLSALGIRIIAPIPGKGTIGIEVPNLKKQIVSMRTLLASEQFINNTHSLPIALGKRIDNENYVVDLATMPHLLMAGATGQGKSVGINTILVSLLYKKHPSQLKFVLVDPKKVELSIYKLIEKHFLAKLPNEEEAIITDTKKVINTLNALCIEMDNRYDLLKDAGVRNIKEYNEKFIKRKLNPNKGHQYLPFIVLVVDEFADLIMTAGKEVEMPIARLAQLARAVGIHLIIATQRPSVNVITGTIKANFPGRIAFRVSAKVDSRTILDTGGADQLIGRGDMLILNGSELVRLQCALVDTPEVERIVEYIGSQQGYPTAFDLPEYEGSDGGDMAVNSGKSLKDVDQMFEQCARLVVSSGSGSTSMLQRRFNLGYNRAGRIMDQLEAAGIVGATMGGKPRELMIHTESELEEILRNIGIL